ncbi:unnamed protein product [Closterium sp. Naga37s-1]|nr:unnamed protein product [Closterium sp. Naga37s-1]
MRAVLSLILPSHLSPTSSLPSIHPGSFPPPFHATPPNPQPILPSTPFPLLSLYYVREDAEDAVKYVSSTILDDRPIRVDFDWGYEDGRQWGRGRSGGQSGWQVRDEYRTDYDPDMCLSRLSFASLACIPLTLMGGGGVEGKSGTNTAPIMTQICASLASIRHISPSPLPRLYGGRGQSGWQVRDEYRTDYDPDMCLSRLSFASLACIPLTLMGGGGVEGNYGMPVKVGGAGEEWRARGYGKLVQKEIVAIQQYGAPLVMPGEGGRGYGKLVQKEIAAIQQYGAPLFMPGEGGSPGGMPPSFGHSPSVPHQPMSHRMQQRLGNQQGPRRAQRYSRDDRQRGGYRGKQLCL